MLAEPTAAFGFFLVKTLIEPKHIINIRVTLHVRTSGAAGVAPPTISSAWTIVTPEHMRHLLRLRGKQRNALPPSANVSFIIESSPDKI